MFILDAGAFRILHGTGRKRHENVKLQCSRARFILLFNNQNWQPSKVPSLATDVK